MPSLKRSGSGKYIQYGVTYKGALHRLKADFYVWKLFTDNSYILHSIPGPFFTATATTITTTAIQRYHGHLKPPQPGPGVAP